WDDDGAAVSGYTDWIADYNASDDPHDVKMADTAAANLFDVTTSRSITLDDGHTFVQTMMLDATRDPDAQLSFGEQNPEVAQSLSKVAATYLDDLSTTDPGTTGVSTGSDE